MCAHGASGYDAKLKHVWQAWFRMSGLNREAFSNFPCSMLLNDVFSRWQFSTGSCRFDGCLLLPEKSLLASLQVLEGSPEARLAHQ